MAFPTKTGSGGSGSKKLAAFKKRAAARAKPGESPSQYRAKAGSQRQQIIGGGGIDTGAPTLSKDQADAIRGITGGGLKVMPGMPMSANIVAALRRDLSARTQRIDNRDTRISNVERRTQNAAAQLNAYNQYIKDGAFVGSNQQYKQYQRDYQEYQTLQNNYNRLVESHNIDVKEYNKNLQNLQKKTRPAEPIAKTIAAYKNASSYISKKLPTPEQAKPAIKFILENAPGPSAYKVLNATPQTRKYAQQIVDFNVGQYESFQKGPLKAAAMFATFAIGGAAIKGLAPAAKALGFGARSTKAAERIGKGMAGVYVLQSGRRVMLVEDARQLGYVTGDIIFNEVLPAGLGLKFGIKVVSKLPKGAKLLKGTGTKIIKESAKVSRLTKEAYVSRKKAWTTRRQVKADGKRLKETVARLRAEKKQVPQWMKDELKVIRASERIKTPESFKRFLADTKGEVSPRVKTKRKAAQQKLITETKTKVKEAKKTEDQLISEFEAQQRAFMAQETKLKQTGAVQKTALEKIQARRQKLRTRQRTNTIQARLQKHRQALKLKEKQAAIEQSKLKKIKSQLVINNAKLAKIAMSAQTLSQIKKLMGEQRTLLTQLPKQQQRYKQAIKNIQKQRTIVLNDMKAINKIITDAKRVASTKTKAKPVTKIKTKPPKPLEIPKIPDMHPEKKPGKIIRRRKVTRSLDTRQFNNAVADISTIFG